MEVSEIDFSKHQSSECLMFIKKQTKQNKKNYPSGEKFPYRELDTNLH